MERQEPDLHDREDHEQEDRQDQQDLDEDLAKQFGISETKGVLVAKVLSGSPSEKGNMRNGDIIKTFDGKPVENVRELLKLVGRAPIGKKVKVVVLRDKKEAALDIEVAQRPDELKEYAETELGNWRGLEVKISEKGGVVVTNVVPGSPTDEAGLRRGDVITEMNKKPIKNLKDYDDATKSAKGDVLVLTSRGYAVVKPSVGFETGSPGEAWLKGVTAAANHVITMGIADSGRLAGHQRSRGPIPPASPRCRAGLWRSALFAAAEDRYRRRS